MAQNATKTISATAWTQLTDADVTSITFQNRSGYTVLVKATTDVTVPTTFDAAISYNPNQGERNVALSDLFPGLTGVKRLWAYADTNADVFVSHA